MMYLSKLIPSPRSRNARRDVYNPYELHRTLASAFQNTDGKSYREHHEVLFRLEPLDHPGAQPNILVQSKSQPDWTELLKDYLLDAQSKSVKAEFYVNQMLSFRLLANPSKKIPVDGKSQGQRVPLFDKLDNTGKNPALEWLSRKGEQFGFHVGFAITHSYWQSFRLSAKHDNNIIKMYAVRYEGLLRVTDPDRLSQGLRSGIGPGKSFGFGLLSLATA